MIAMLLPPSCRLLSLAVRSPDAKGRMDGQVPPGNVCVGAAGEASRNEALTGTFADLTLSIAEGMAMCGRGT